MKKRTIVNIHHAKTHLSRLLEQVSAGDEVIIAKSGKPIARLLPFTRPGKRLLGVDQGRVKIADDFDAPLPQEVLSEFER